MLTHSKALNVMGVDNLEKAKEFYIQKLGLNETGSSSSVTLILDLGEGATLMLYSDENHTAASSAAITFHVDDIDVAVEQLIKVGIKIDYEDAIVTPDKKGIVRNRTADRGPDVALFKDPSGNILSVLQF